MIFRLVLAALLCLPIGALAQSRVTTGHAQSTLAAERSGFAPGGTTWFVLEQTLEKGWHVYWKNPGDSGLPLELIWDLPPGFEAGDIVYPTPEEIPVGPLTNFGHHGTPAFLVPITAPASARVGDAIEIGLRATWLICEEVCVPEEGAFSLSLPIEGAPARIAAVAAVADAARAASPETFDADATFSVTADAVTVSMRAPEGATTSGYFFPQPEGLIEPAAKQTIKRAGDRFLISMKPGFAAANVSDEIKGVYAYGEGAARRGYEFTASESAEPIALAAGASGASGGWNVPLLLLAALAGGALLNLMPCVFPVIFIKAASLMKAAGVSRAAMRQDGLLYTAGVVAAFAALGGALLALRAGGEQLGWGFHLQSPAIVLLSAYVLFLVGLNLAGVFEVGGSLQGVGGSLATKRGAAGSFFTGVLAVVVAAPCIGPFLTAPIGAAVVLPPMIGLLIFIAMALGLAAPYLALSLAPKLAALLPKPGGWMVVFKQALAFPVFAGAAYFLWVLAQQTGAGGLATALGGAILLAFAAWLFEMSKSGGARMLAIRGLAAVAALTALAPIAGLRLIDRANAAPERHGALQATPFDEAQIEALRAEGQGVFVDFTAAWCVVCQLNKITIFSRPELASAFAANDVAFMVADWTKRDEKITAALARFGANGVPLYVYYPPEGEPRVLPLPLTARAITDAIAESS